MIQISKLLNNEEKSNVANCILRQLPEWFGIEESIIEYVNVVKKTGFYPLEEIKEIWGEKTPCLIMVKKL